MQIGKWKIVLNEEIDNGFRTKIYREDKLYLDFFSKNAVDIDYVIDCLFLKGLLIFHS
jgi:hypothetical protein